MAGFDFKSLSDKAKAFVNTVTKEVTDKYNDMTKKTDNESKVDPNGTDAQNPPEDRNNNNKV